jgi:hypothetical protein
MKIEDVEKLADRWNEGDTRVGYDALCALRAEAWHPIEKAEELGAKDGRWVIVMHERWSQASWIWAGWVDYDSRPINGITHFRFINPPEN